MSLHDDEVVSTPDLVRRLVADQLPRWAHLPVTPGPAGGTDHHLFRLGGELLVRMPKVAWAQDQAGSDARWLPVLAPHLPLRVPAPEAVGEPGQGFPFRWSVTPWLEGASPAVGELGTGAGRAAGVGQLLDPRRPGAWQPAGRRRDPDRRHRLGRDRYRRPGRRPDRRLDPARG